MMIINRLMYLNEEGLVTIAYIEPDSNIKKVFYSIKHTAYSIIYR